MAAEFASRKAEALKAAADAADEKYSAAEKEIGDLKEELSALKQFRADKLAEERHAAEEAVFARFPELEGVEAFDALRADCSELSLEALENKCFEIKGRNAALSFSAPKAKPTRVPASDGKKDGAEAEPYGGLFVKYPPKN